MPFPEVERVIYKRNPLLQVICQLRFPAILKIETESPAVFQEHIRAEYPDFEEIAQSRLENLPNVGGLVPSQILSQISMGPKRSYKFKTTDQIWEVSLTRTFLALMTTNYVRWEEFRNRLSSPMKALFSAYSPASITRIGLRYIDVIKRTTIGLSKDEPWHELLSSRIIGPLTDPNISRSLTAAECLYEITLREDAGSVRIKVQLVEDANDGEQCVMIDSDFSDSGVFSADEAVGKLEILHTKASRLIRWCILDKLHNALQPSVVR